MKVFKKIGSAFGFGKKEQDEEKAEPQEEAENPNEVIFDLTYQPPSLYGPDRNFVKKFSSAAPVIDGRNFAINVHKIEKIEFKMSAHGIMVVCLDSNRLPVGSGLATEIGIHQHIVMHGLLCSYKNTIDLKFKNPRNDHEYYFQIIPGGTNGEKDYWRSRVKKLMSWEGQAKNVSIYEISPESTSDNGGTTDEEKTPEPEPVKEPEAPEKNKGLPAPKTKHKGLPVPVPKTEPEAPKKNKGLPAPVNAPEPVNEPVALAVREKVKKLNKVLNSIKEDQRKNQIYGGMQAALEKQREKLNKAMKQPTGVAEEAQVEASTRRLAANDSMENVFTMMWILPLLVIFVFWFKRYIVTSKNNDDNDIVQDNANEDENSLNNMV